MEEKKRTSFVLQKDLIDILNPLPDEYVGLIFKQIFAYVNNIPVENMDELTTMIVNNIELEWDKFNPKTKKYHWNYKGGITPENKEIRASLKYQIWRSDVFKRDKYKCMECGQIGGELNAHHIKDFANHKASRLDIDNGITLCKKCHIKTHKKIKA